MKSGSQLILWLAVATAITLSGFAVYKSVTGSKLAYVELSTVFSGFEMTKEYKKKLESVVSARKVITDSLEFDLKARVRFINSTLKHSDQQFIDYENRKEMYMEKAKQFDEDNMALKQQLDQDIYKQLNQYIKEYGQKHGYTFIFGAEGSGVLMYAKEGGNVSKEVVEYINKRYQGEDK